jgi:uncharacterized protein YndB with AHSA1/START domain
MTDRDAYTPGPARDAHVTAQNGDNWTFVITRTLKHSPERVWRALTEPEQLRAWAPFDADADMSTTGAVVQLITVGAPSLHVTATVVTRAEPPNVLEYQWGGRDMRWVLEPVAEGTRLTLWANIDRRYIAMGAAGWHVCLDVLDRSLSAHPLGRIVGPDAMRIDGWAPLLAGYAKVFGIEPRGAGPSGQ